MVDINKTKETKTQLTFQITQHGKDKHLMEKFIDYFGCGSLRVRGDIVDFRVRKLSDILEKIIPFFEKYHVVGVKLRDFYDFCAVANIMKNGITNEGLNEIRKIKSNMNRLRK